MFHGRGSRRGVVAPDESVAISGVHKPSCLATIVVVEPWIVLTRTRSEKLSPAFLTFFHLIWNLGCYNYQKPKKLSRQKDSPQYPGRDASRHAVDAKTGDKRKYFCVPSIRKCRWYPWSIRAFPSKPRAHTLQTKLLLLLFRSLELWD